MSERTPISGRVRTVATAVRRRPERSLARGAVLLGLLVAGAFFVAPLYWLLSAALESSGASYPPTLVPSTVELANFVELLTGTAFIRTYLVNSLVVSAATVVLTVAIATPAGYALARYDLPHRRAIMASLVAVQLMPLLSLVVPLYRAFALLGLLDSLAPVVLVETALTVPVSIWLISGYYETLPAHLEEAASVGGATRWAAFKAVAPMARPAIGASALYAFVLSWNQFLIPLTFTTSRANWTYPVGMYEFVSRYGVVDWGLLGAAALVAMVPVLTAFVLFQRQFVAGVLGGGFGGGPR